MAVLAALPDWQDARAYAWLAGADRACFAWEWLRRNAHYRRDWRDAGAAFRFGLVRCEDPELDARVALPLWRAGCDPAVLQGVIADRVRAGGMVVKGAVAFDFATLKPMPRLIVDGEVEHIRIGDGRHAVRIDLRGAGFLDTPVVIVWHLVGVTGLQPSLRALRRLSSLCRGACVWPGEERRAGRWILALRAHDAIAAGASHQDIARCFFAPLIVSRRWRVDAPSIRLRVQRLVRSAHALAALPASDWFH